jgi:hypothetical protein
MLSWLLEGFLDRTVSPTTHRGRIASACARIKNDEKGFKTFAYDANRLAISSFLLKFFVLAADMVKRRVCLLVLQGGLVSRAALLCFFTTDNALVAQDSIGTLEYDPGWDWLRRARPENGPQIDPRRGGNSS